MLQVHDLNLKRDILPLFDYTIGDYAAEVLYQVLQTVPDTVEEVYGRQNILKSFISNWQVIGSYTYQRLDAREVCVFLNDIATRRLVVEQNKFKAAFQLFTGEEERHRLRSKSVQTILLLHKLQTTCFQRLDVKAFPEPFRKQLETMLGFLQQLNLTANAYLIRENKFSLSAATRFCKTLSSLSENEVSSFWKSMAYFEAYWSIAKGVVANNLCFPTFSEDAFTIEDFYHPILEKPVKNSLQLTPLQHVVLITGPNMSGKSTLLRSVGLCVYLAHIGFGVPASSCTLPFFHTIAIIINANDNLRSGYSHFMSEIQNLKTVVQEAGAAKKCFAVFDEIFRGTNIEDALEITRTTVNGLTKYSNSYFFISTHLLQLKDDVASDKIKKYNIACELDNDYPRFSYQLQEGWSDLKIGKILFEKEGLAELLTH
ncbi:MutS-related protein [Pontibacter rugosus]|uniref:DNA mismatch repair proteins mutS family domain-containing protein n=1 Tax=Pontibacter rugosus TaxID=1745966 RepID=A0ABW3SKI5_9BACT